MKQLLNYTLAFLCLCLITACESDLEKAEFIPEKSLAPVLTGVGDTYILEEESAADTVMELTWTKAEPNIPTQFVYNIEMDLAGNDFQNKVTLASLDSKTTNYFLTVDELNGGIIKRMGNDINYVEYNFEIRAAAYVSSVAKPILSNVEKSAITPYYSEPEYPKIALRGGYADLMWGYNPSQFVFSGKDDNQYSAWVVFGAGQASTGWKLCEDVDWLIQWGSPSGVQPEATLIQLEPRTSDNPDPAAITAYSGYSYKFLFNKSNNELQVLHAVESWGIHIVGSDQEDTRFNLLAKEMTPAGKYNWYLRGDVNVTEDVNVIFRADNKDDVYFGLAGNGKLKEGGDPIPVEAGRYRIRFYFNKVEPYYELIPR